MKDVRQLKCNRFYTYYWNALLWSRPSNNTGIPIHFQHLKFATLHKYHPARAQFKCDMCSTIHHLMFVSQESQQFFFSSNVLIWNKNKEKEEYFHAANASDQFNKEHTKNNPFSMIVAVSILLTPCHHLDSFTEHHKGKNSMKQQKKQRIRNKMCTILWCRTKGKWKYVCVGLIVLCIKCNTLEMVDNVLRGLSLLCVFQLNISGWCSHMSTSHFNLKCQHNCIRQQWECVSAPHTLCSVCSVRIRRVNNARCADAVLITQVDLSGVAFATVINEMTM